METLLFFISGLMLGAAITYFYYDARIQRLHAQFVKIESMVRDRE
jgi:hypothetical protein